MSLIFIDWFSPVTHKKFNDGIIDALKREVECYYFFTKKLRNNKVKSRYLLSKENRILQFITVYKLVLMNKDSSILFLTYDPIFLPFISLMKHVFVFEHNTIPKKTISTLAVYQYLFYRNITRLTQCITHAKKLLQIKQKAIFVGSPLTKINFINNIKSPKCFIVPNNRVNKNDILKLRNFFDKKTVFFNGDEFKKEKMNTFYKIEVPYIDIPPENFSVLAIIAAGNNLERFSGWFHEAIGRNIPLIIASKNDKIIFEEAFPNFPFFYLQPNSSIKDLQKFLAKKYKNEQYINKMQLKLREKLLNVFEL
jgi:hypothetical protein